MADRHVDSECNKEGGSGVQARLKTLSPDVVVKFQLTRPRSGSGTPPDVPSPAPRGVRRDRAVGPAECSGGIRGATRRTGNKRAAGSNQNTKSGGRVGSTVGIPAAVR